MVTWTAEGPWYFVAFSRAFSETTGVNEVVSGSPTIYRLPEKEARGQCRNGMRDGLYVRHLWGFGGSPRHAFAFAQDLFSK